MSISIDRPRVAGAYDTVVKHLIAQRNRRGYWDGQLASSPLATATAISALVIAEQYGSPETHGRQSENLFDADQVFQSDLSELIVQGLHWLAHQQNDDGGWGDTDRSKSNLAATVLVDASFHLTGVPAKYANLLQGAQQYIKRHGGLSALRKINGKDRLLVSGILANCALAGLVEWDELTGVPLDTTGEGLHWWGQSKRHHCSHPAAARIAVGQAKFHHAPPINPVTRLIRRTAKIRSLAVLEQLQRESGGFDDSTLQTSFVVMALASMGLAEHQIVRRGVEFLLSSVRSDGSWPVQGNMAARNSALAINATSQSEAEHVLDSRAVDWLINCQQTPDNQHSLPQGGWSRSGRPDGPPDVETTAVALCTIVAHTRCDGTTTPSTSAARGAQFLLTSQHEDGGWPTCPKQLPADGSAVESTALAIRALSALATDQFAGRTSLNISTEAVACAIERGINYLAQCQQRDGCWIPTWYGNEHNAAQKNPVVGTSLVLKALTDAGYGDSEMARRAGNYLVAVQLAGGGWGPVCEPKNSVNREYKRTPHPPGIDAQGSVEETSLAISALSALAATGKVNQSVVQQGLAWLIDAIENGRHTEPAPIGFYFDKLWYYERLYPLCWAAEALRAATEFGCDGALSQHALTAP